MSRSAGEGSWSTSRGGCLLGSTVRLVVHYRGRSRADQRLSAIVIADREDRLLVRSPRISVITALCSACPTDRPRTCSRSPTCACIATSNGPASVSHRRTPHQHPRETIRPAMADCRARSRTASSNCVNTGSNRAWTPAPHGRLPPGDRTGTTPAISTIHKVLRQRGFITPQPRKRPRNSYIRFQAEQPDECWRADITHWHLADAEGTAGTGPEIEVLDLIDDHSRKALACTARPVSTAIAVRDCFRHAYPAHRLPASVLSDNGMVVTARHAPRHQPRLPNPTTKNTPSQRLRVFTMSETSVLDVSRHHTGGAEGTRTPDPLVANEVRYQLRYSPAKRVSGRSPNRSTTLAGGHRRQSRVGPAAFGRWTRPAETKRGRRRSARDGGQPARRIRGSSDWSSA